MASWKTAAPAFPRQLAWRAPGTPRSSIKSSPRSATKPAPEARTRSSGPDAQPSPAIPAGAALERPAAKIYLRLSHWAWPRSRACRYAFLIGRHRVSGTLPNISPLQCVTTAEGGHQHRSRQCFERIGREERRRQLLARRPGDQRVMLMASLQRQNRRHTAAYQPLATRRECSARSGVSEVTSPPTARHCQMPADTHKVAYDSEVR